MNDTINQRRDDLMELIVYNGEAWVNPMLAIMCWSSPLNFDYAPPLMIVSAMAPPSDTILPTLLLDSATIMFEALLLTKFSLPFMFSFEYTFYC